MYDLIGDVHGCIDELRELLTKLGYADKGYGPYQHANGRKVVFVGDLNDRGPDSVSVLSLVMGMVRNGSALCVLGNHDAKLVRYLKGNKIQASHGLAETITQLERETPEFRADLYTFLSGLPHELTLDGGKLSVSHAGLDEDLQGKTVTSDKARSRALFGKTTGKKDEHGYPERLDWAADYKGSTIVVHGHVPVPEVVVKNNVWDIDTGVPFGNKLTALRYPEMELVQVKAAKNYSGILKFGSGSA